MFLMFRQSGGGTDAVVAVPKPDLAGLEPIIVQAIEKAQSKVRRSPNSDLAWGELGKTYWVYDLNEAAKKCLAQASALRPKEGRWAYFHSLAFLPEDPAGCIPVLKTAVKLLGESRIKPRLRLAQLLSGQGKFEQAETHFNTILTQDPGNAPATLGLGKTANAAGRIDEAKSLLISCSTNQLTSKAANELLAGIYLREGNTAASEKAKKIADRIESDKEWEDPFVVEASSLRTGRAAWLDHAEHLIRAKKFNEASPIIDLLLQHYPNEPKAHLHKGRIELVKRNLPDAETAFRLALQYDPTDVEAKVQLGVALFYQQLFKEAEVVLQEAVTLSPNLAEAHFNLGLSQTSQGKTEAAIESFQSAIRFKPNLADSYIGLGTALATKGDIDGAVKSIKQALELKPGDPRATSLLTQIQNSQIERKPEP
jgi:tetratricopeptide (TPR) repeat protein